MVCKIFIPNVDNTHWYNFHPISLINVDIKNRGKVLANRGNSILGSLIHEDEVGFFPLCEVADNVRKKTLLTEIAKNRKVLSMF